MTELNTIINLPTMPAPVARGLKPINLIGAAAVDLGLRKAKLKFQADDDRPYSFARQHVRKATSVGHLLAIALFEPAPKTDKRSTLIVYGDRDLLRAALIELLSAEGEADVF